MHLRFDVSNVEASDTESSRVLRGLAVPFNTVAKLGDVEYSFSRGSLKKARDVTPVVLDHDLTRPVGVLVDMKDGDDGVEIVASIDRTPDGDSALQTAMSGSRSGLSIGVDIIDSQDVEGVKAVSSASLLELSLTSVAAYPEAKVTAVTASTEPEVTAEAPINDPQEVKMETTHEEVVEKHTEVTVTASSAPEKMLSLDEYVRASIAAQRGDRKAAEVIAALDLTTTDDASGVVPVQLMQEILDKQATPRTLYSVVGKRSLTDVGKEIIFPQALPSDATFDGWRAFDSVAASTKFEIQSISVPVQPWSAASSVHQDLEQRGIGSYISYTVERLVDLWYTAVENYLGDTLNNAAQAATSFSDAVEKTYVAGRPYAKAPNLLLATPEFHAYLLDAQGEMRYSSGSASAQPYSGSIGGMNVVVAPTLGANMIMHSSALQYMESPNYRLTAANVSALSYEMAITTYSAAFLQYPQSDGAGGFTAGTTDLIWSFPTP